MKAFLPLLAMLLAAAPLRAQFEFRDVDGKSLQLSENGAPVFVFNYGTMLPAGVPADRARCCYFHPVYAPNGAVVSDDFPRDHYHHRGIFWAWPVVTVDGKNYDGWLLKGIGPRFEKWIARDVSAAGATLAAQDGWYVGERKVVEEEIRVTAHPAANGKRDLDFTVTLRPTGADVSITGTSEGNKGYGGFNLRFAPRTGTTVAAAGRSDVPDSDHAAYPWAELAGDFSGKRASARIAIDAANPGFPNAWCLRHYGFLGVNFPGLTPYHLDAARPLVMQFRVTLAAGDAAPARPKILVYTRNGKGYVHDNIEDSVRAIRKMGGEGGFDVDVTVDPNFFTPKTLAQYRAIVFANTNNEAFDNDIQRDAFKHYIESGGGFVGIHSASGSERNWPYFWSVIGGRFLYHPKLQPFTVRVVDAAHPAVRGLPATFEWEDECYHLEYLNPDLHPLLVTDPAKLDDKDRARHPFGLVGHDLPLSWTLQVDGGREFYTALGHKKEHYANPILYRHILDGIRWAMNLE
ncbi:MAG: ThuA domain-containing protein [Acidobacteriota bacterium]|nr:ThuA domain-containing protein [Acidobacteriota bacterium]